MKRNPNVARAARVLLRALFVASVSAAWWATETDAHAQVSPPPSTYVPPPRWIAERPRETRWYGYQTLITDGVALGLFAGAMATLRLCISWSSNHTSSCDNHTSEMLGVSSFAVYGFGAPIVHGAHGNWGKAGISLGMRAAPIGLAAVLVSNGSEGSAPILLGSLFTVFALDSALLANEEVEPEAPSFALAPAYDPRTRAGGFVATGAF
jgi:hypothetical protein